MSSDPHKALHEKYGDLIDAYIDGRRGDTDKVAKLYATVPEWPLTTEDLVVYRGQGSDTKLPNDGFSRLPMATTTDITVTRRPEFAGPTGPVFQITVKPGIPYLDLRAMNPSEQEMLVVAPTSSLSTRPDRILATYGDKKVKVGKYSAIPVTLSPKPTGGRRRRQLSSSTRYTRRKIKHKLASWNPRIHTQRAMESSIRPTEKQSRGRRSGGGPGGSRDPSCS